MMRKLILLRRFSQTFFLFFFVYVLWTAASPPGCGVNPAVLFKIDPNLIFFISIAERMILPGIILAFIVPVLTLIFGRFFCGWMCPLGTLIDFAGSFKKHSARYSDNFNRRISFLKYAVLIIIALAAFAGIQIAWVFDPLVLTARAILWNLIPAVNLFVDKLFVFILKAAGQTVAGYNAHEILKNSFLAGKTAYFVNVPFIPVFFLAVIIPSLFLSRFWCRIFCPLGGIYSIFAGYSLMERVTVGCVNCGQCDKYCRMGAINKDGSYRKGECVLCMDCVYMCKACAVKFNFKRDKPGRSLSSDTGNKKGITRKDFLFLLAGSFLALGLKRKKKTVSAYPGNLIRPPGVIDEKQFFNRCVRCGNCMRICPTNVLQPVLLEAGIEGIWTPHLVNEIGYCEYNCNSCGEVCPTGAIPELKLHIKQKTKIGIARIDRDKCVAWAENRQCLVCEKYCPVAGKAIKIDNIVIEGKVVGRPVVDTEACIGCGICQNKCPVRPERAVKIYPGPAR